MEMSLKMAGTPLVTSGVCVEILDAGLANSVQ